MSDETGISNEGQDPLENMDNFFLPTFGGKLNFGRLVAGTVEFDVKPNVTTAVIRVQKTGSGLSSEDLPKDVSVKYHKARGYYGRLDVPVDLTQKERDIVIAMFFRNYGAHVVKNLVLDSLKVKEA